jgi:hypothetical protein
METKTEKVGKNFNDDQKNEIKQIASDFLLNTAKKRKLINKDFKDHTQSERILELLFYKAENPNVRRYQFIEHVVVTYGVSKRTAARYWSIMDYREQQSDTMLILIDQQYLKADQEGKGEICAQLLELKYNVILNLQ